MVVRIAYGITGQTNTDFGDEKRISVLKWCERYNNICYRTSVANPATEGGMQTFNACLILILQ